MTKEQIYDDQIFPLMKQIIAICEEHKIAMIADFALSDEDLEDLKCTTALLAEEFDPPDEMLHALEILRPKPKSPITLTTTHADGSTTVHTIL